MITRDIGQLRGCLPTKKKKTNKNLRKKEKRAEFEKEVRDLPVVNYPDKLIDIRHRISKGKEKALKLWRRGQIMH